MSFLVNFITVMSVINSLIGLVPRSLNVAYGPFCVAIGCALLTGLLQTGIKIRHQKYIFEHFYLMMVGMVFCLAGGSVLAAVRVNDETALMNFTAGCYLIAIGVGTTYVPALSYINIKTANKNYRTVEIAFSHCWYLLGFAIGTVITTHSYTNQILDRNLTYEIVTAPTAVFGYYMLGFSALVLVVYGAIEVMHYLEMIDYRKSEDEFFERENEKCAILEEKYFPCHQNEVNLRMVQDPTESPSRIKYILVVAFLVCSRGKNLVLFFVPLLLINSLFSVFGNGFQNFTPYVGYFLAFAGVLTSTILLRFVSVKVGFIVSCIIKILSLLCCVIPVITVGLAADETRIYFWCLYFFLGFGYSHPDIDILELIDFKLNELVLSVAFAIELTIICVVQFLTLHTLERTLSDEGTSVGIRVFLWFVIVFVMILPILGIAAAFALPNTYGKTLLQIKNQQSGYKTVETDGTPKPEIDPENIPLRMC